MDHFDRSVLQELADKTDGTLISIYMPTLKAGQDTRQNTIRLRNMLRSAEDQSIDAGVRRSDARKMLQPAQALLDNSEFWQHQDDGLAIFAGVDFFRAYRLPVAFRELVIVADRLHIKPLLQLFTEDGEFFVLALSLNHVRLLGCGSRQCRPIVLHNIPRDFDDYMQVVEQQKQVQFHTRTQPRPGERAAVFHAGGSESDNAVHKKNVQDYLRLVQQSVDRRLNGRRWPLVLAGTDFVRATFRELSGYRHIADHGVGGCPDRLSDAELHQRAWPVVQPIFSGSANSAISDYQMAEGTPLGGDDLRQIVRSAYHGGVGVLFVALSDERWGRYDPGRDEVVIHDRRQPGDVDLLDFAATHTLLHHGKVFAIGGRAQGNDEQPGVAAAGSVLAGRSAAAVFRSPGVHAIARSAE